MVTLTAQQWADRDAKIKAIEEQRIAQGWTKDQFGRWIEPIKGESK